MKIFFRTSFNQMKNKLYREKLINRKEMAWNWSFKTKFNALLFAQKEFFLANRKIK